MHRAHLHKVLHDKVVELGVPVHLASTVVRYDLNDALFVLESGVEVRADLIVAADGESPYVFGAWPALMLGASRLEIYCQTYDPR